MNKLKELFDLGQSVWLDFISREILDSGELKRLVAQGVTGVTSNPTIFDQAISGGKGYDDDIALMVKKRKTVEQIYLSLAGDDIKRACDELLPVYEGAGCGDGFVSLEVDPTLAHETEATIEQALSLFNMIGRPNLMIKVPATKEGLPAITDLISQGVNVNVTLIFSLNQYRAVAEAYLQGLEKLAAKKGDLSKVASVASLFVSRVDTAVDSLLEEKGIPGLLGKTALANAKASYAVFKELFSGRRWEALAQKGAGVQRCLWASTGTKNPNYKDTLYVDELIGPQTVNTLPPHTLKAFIDHGEIKPGLEEGLEQALTDLDSLAGFGIDIEAVCEDLQQKGVKSFEDSFTGLMESIAVKREKLLSDTETVAANLGESAPAADMAMAEIRDKGLMARIWAKDHTLWQPEPDEVANRLGWLDIAIRMKGKTGELNAFRQDILNRGVKRCVLLGMGGSSLAPEVFAEVFGPAPGHPGLSILDTTDPDAIKELSKELDLGSTLFLVATKSGGTVETISLFKFFYNQALKELGRERAGRHFAAITDSGSKLHELAEDLSFGKVFLNDPEIGGRYSALSYFGLVPAALLGMNLDRLLDSALMAASNCQAGNCPIAGDNNGARLGAMLGALAGAGRDKLTFLASPSLRPFSAWLEQLIAESTGKNGKGILPVADEPEAPAGSYGPDRLFAYLRMDGEYKHDARVLALEEAGQPVIWLRLGDLYDIAYQMFIWEMAVAVAGHFLGINPFNQPNVESAKKVARQMAAEYQKTGGLPEDAPALELGGIRVYTDTPAETPGEALRAFLGRARPGGYVALQAYVNPSLKNRKALERLRAGLLDKTGLATTLGYGPRFLHSTGQLHKGDAGKGLFVQIVSGWQEDVAIPDRPGGEGSSLSFGILKLAQAMGDRKALLDAGREVLSLNIQGELSEALASLG